MKKPTSSRKDPITLNAELLSDAFRWRKLRSLMTHERHADAIGWTLSLVLPGDDPDSAIDAAKATQ